MLRQKAIVTPIFVRRQRRRKTNNEAPSPPKLEHLSDSSEYDGSVVQGWIEMMSPLDSIPHNEAVDGHLYGQSAMSVTEESAQSSVQDRDNKEADIC